MKRSQIRGFVLAVATVGAIGWLAAAGGTTQPQAEVFSATAAIDSPSGQASMPIEIRIDRFASDTERDDLLTVVKANDAKRTLQALEQRPDVGAITLAKRVTPIKYAYARPTGGGRLITVVTAKPILFVGAGVPDAKPKTGHDLAIAILTLDDRDTGVGEIALAANVKATEAGAIQTTDYGRETVRLTRIARKR